jgi:hypothetical protein
MTEPRIAGLDGPRLAERRVQVRNTVERLNELLETAQARMETTSRLIGEATTPEMRALFEQVREDEAWSCAGLANCITRASAKRPGERGDVGEQVTAVPTLPDRLRLLNRGQRWAIARIAELLDKPIYRESRAFLEEMRAVHVQNAGRCEELIMALDREAGRDPLQARVPAAATGARKAAVG